MSLKPIATCLIALISTVSLPATAAMPPPPFNSVYVVEGTPIHKLLISDPNTEGTHWTAQQYRNDILKGESLAEPSSIHYKAPVFWVNNNSNFNANFVERHSASVVHAADWLARTLPVGGSIPDWCEKSLQLVKNSHAYGEFRTTSACSKEVRLGISLAEAPVLDSVLLDSVSEDPRSPKILLTLQYTCDRCHSVPPNLKYKNNILFQVSALIELLPNGGFAFRSLALPALIQQK